MKHGGGVEDRTACGALAHARVAMGVNGDGD